MGETELLIAKYRKIINPIICSNFKELYTSYLKEEAFSGGLIGLWKGIEKMQSLNIKEEESTKFLRQYIIWGVREVLRTNSGIKRMQFKVLEAVGEIPEFEVLDLGAGDIRPNETLDNPLDILIDRESMQLLLKAINELPRIEREYITRRLRGDKLQDIAKNIGEAPETGCKRVRDSVSFLRDRLKEVVNG